jgi:hypothetical protein
MKNRHSGWPFGRRVFGAVAVCAMLLAAGCRRAPQTAAELSKALPPAFAGDVHLQGDTEVRRLRIEARELSIRSEHVLEFNRVDYQVLDARGATSSAGEVRIRGTITAPGFDIHLETVAGGGGDDAIRPETFTGKLSGNLRSLDAEWSTGLGQKVRLTMQAASP